MYTFEDRGGDSLTLRPEATACVLARLYRAWISGGAQAGPALHDGPDVPVRAAAGRPLPAVPSGQCRGARRDASRARRRGDRHADGLLRRPRPGRPSRATRQLDWGYRDAARLCFEARRVSRPAPVGALRRMPGANRAKPAAVLDCKTPGCQPIIEKAPSILDSLSPEAPEHFDSVRRSLDAMGIDVQGRSEAGEGTRLLRAHHLRGAHHGARRHRTPWPAVGATTASSPSSTVRLDPGSASRSVSSGSCYSSATRSELQALSRCSFPSARPRCSACCPAARRARQGGVPWSWVTACGNCRESSSGPIGSARRGR